MANIFQKVFLSKLECQLIDTINKNDIKSTYSEDLPNMFITSSYRINSDRLKVVATHRWHHAQGNDFSLIVEPIWYFSRLPRKYATPEAQQQLARKIYTRMREKYIKQK